ncbi:helix-turn-helix transcriptional regulator [Bacillus salitolerans]|uniref:Helix-turn-helix transcriptional regulator n=1 Tax=Bacillus salitolerans TaxID=1437434 RepID=A0ABW4LN22_9BACI
MLICDNLFIIIGATSIYENIKELTNMLIHNPLDKRLQVELQWDLAVHFLSIHNGSHADKFIKAKYKTLYRPIHGAIDFLHENFKLEIDLNDLANVSGVSKSHLFKFLTGFTPHQYLLMLRLNYAQKLLIETDLSVTTIAFKAGFGSLSTFERVFKKKYKITASSFRTSI